MTRHRIEAQRPWLEHYPEDGGSVRRTPLDGVSLTIGRAESADLQIDSARVSREHARIEIRDGKYFLQDLASTNHTFVNGQRIDRVALADGDVILVGDSQVTFLMNSASRLRRMATQPILPGSPGDRRSGDTRTASHDVRDAILSVRRSHEAILQQFANIELKCVVENSAGAVLAHWVKPLDGVGRVTECNGLAKAPSKHIVLRRKQLSRRVAVERAAAIDAPTQLVLPIESWEVANSDELLWHFESLRQAMPNGIPLVASVVASDAVDLLQIGRLCGRLRDRGVGIACHEFIGSEAQVRDLQDVRPGLLFLAAELSREVLGNSRQAQRMAGIRDACRDLGIQAVISDSSSAEATAACVDLGFALFVQGPAAARDAAPLLSAAPPSASRASVATLVDE